MKTITLKKKPFDEKILKRKFAEESDCLNLVEGHFKLIDEDTSEVVALCVPIEDKESSHQLRSAMLNVKNWTVASRGSGIKTTAKVFGYQPRNPIRQRPFCHKGVLSREQPKVHEQISNFAITAESLFFKYLPLQALEQKNKLLEKVKPDWRIKSTMYTSGICNNNNALGYHRDRGNFEDFWSAMAVFKNNIEGGNLIVKDYDIKIKFTDDSIFYFNGMRWWHGVTPIKKLSKDSYRFSVVYYALKEMWKCMSIEDELQYAIKTRQETEIKRMRKK